MLGEPCSCYCLIIYCIYLMDDGYEVLKKNKYSFKEVEVRLFSWF